MTAGYFRTSSRLAAVSTRSQHAATRSDGSCDAARSTASAILRTIPRAAAPRSSRPFQISMRIRSRWRRSSRHTSTDGDGFAGRVGSSKRPVQPFGEPKAEFLRYEMACVARPRICDVAVEADRQRPVERNADRNPRCNRHALPVTSLEVTDLRLAQTDPPPEHSLRKSSSVSMVSIQAGPARTLDRGMNMGALPLAFSPAGAPRRAAACRRGRPATARRPGPGRPRRAPRSARRRS